MDKVKLGVIGIGNMGSAHCQHIMQGLCPEVELVAVADTNPARLEWAKENLAESVVRFATAEELLDSRYHCGSALFSSAHCDKSI